MQDTNIPLKFPIPWGNAAASGTIRAIPQASQPQTAGVVGTASLSDGFPNGCFTPIAAGGSWPWGQDLNGILNQITKWQQWQQAGGAIPYDATFQAAIGGYPKNAIIGSAATAGLFWLSTADANTTNPDSGGAGWLRWPLTRNGEVVSADFAPNPSFAGTVSATGPFNGAAVNVTGNLAGNSATISSGARNSGTGSRVVNLADFSNDHYGTYVYINLPDGTIIQAFGGNSTTGTDTVTFPIAFPNVCGAVVVTEAHPDGWLPYPMQPSIFGAGSVNAANFTLYSVVWSRNTAAWAQTGNIAFQYIAVGY